MTCPTMPQCLLLSSARSPGQLPWGHPGPLQSPEMKVGKAPLVQVRSPGLWPAQNRHLEGSDSDTDDVPLSA